MLDKKYDRFILVSGVDTPLVSKKVLKEGLTSDFSYMSVWQEITTDDHGKLHNEFFKRHHYQSFLTNPGEAYITKSRLKIYSMLMLNKIIALVPLKQIFSYKTYAKGSQWWVLTRELATHILTELQDSNNCSQFKRMHAPDEKIFHTVALNSPFKHKISIDKGQEQLKQGLHYIDWGIQTKTNRLALFTPDDIEKAKLLGCYFARKVDNTKIEYFINYIKKLAAL